MLVLTRRTGETVFLDVPAGQGCRIAVTVVLIDSCNVRLGFAAPRSVAIHRDDAGRTTPPPPALTPEDRQ